MRAMTLLVASKIEKWAPPCCGEYAFGRPWREKQRPRRGRGAWRTKVAEREVAIIALAKA